MKLKKILLSIVAIAIIIAICFAAVKGGKKFEKSGKIQVVTSNFACYDFLRAVIGDSENIELVFIMGPGKDAHSYDPTAQDIVKIQDADLFVYVGGEMEQWSEKVLDSLDNKNQRVVCIADFVDTIEEKEVDGAEEEEEHDHEHHHDDGDEGEEHHHDEEEEEEHHHHEEGAFDEHIWTSPENAIKMVNALEKQMEELDKDNAKKYKENAENYIAQIKEVDQKIQSVVDNKKRDRLVFADKMPMQYFIDYYGLNVTAAFNGCSSETEPSAKTIAYIENTIKKEKIPVVLYIELNNGKVAKTIANEIGNGCEALQIQTLHNVSLDDFNNGETWVSLMNKNVEVLKKALQ